MEGWACRKDESSVPTLFCRRGMIISLEMVNLSRVALQFILFGLVASALHSAPVQLVDEKPLSIRKDSSGVYVVDFGRVAFGNIRLKAPVAGMGAVTVHFGEANVDGRVDRKPPGSVRYQSVEITLDETKSVLVAPPKDKRNTTVTHSTNPPAILTPAEWGVVMPFRWVEVEGWEGELKAEHIVRQSAFLSAWDDEAASFECSDPMLNRIWEFCRYSIKATTFAGIYVDGDRERIPYEADAYLNQLSHYYTDGDKEMARDSIAHLFEHGTWPTEWASHMILMVHADWMWTSDKQWLGENYELLKGKLLTERQAEDSLIASQPKHIKRGDIVDWPKGERDGYVFTERNTVVNAFHLRTLKLMEELAQALGKQEDAAHFAELFLTTRKQFQRTFFNEETGLYQDGVGTEHSSLHANLFPLAFGLVEEKHRRSIGEWLAKRGMKGSVYVAQYLLEALFEDGAAEQALGLMTAEGDRSWRHMIESGATISWEAWDQKYKPNQDWNHAWGAAPANLLPRYILGVEPFSPGYETALIRPNTGGLQYAKGKVPTGKGPIFVEWLEKEAFRLELSLPKGVRARVELPKLTADSQVYLGGEAVSAESFGERWLLHLGGKEERSFELEVRPG